MGNVNCKNLCKGDKDIVMDSARPIDVCVNNPSSFRSGTNRLRGANPKRPGLDSCLMRVSGNGYEILDSGNNNGYGNTDYDTYEYNSGNSSYPKVSKITRIGGNNYSYNYNTSDQYNYGNYQNEREYPPDERPISPYKSAPYSRNGVQEISALEYESKKN